MPSSTKRSSPANGQEIRQIYEDELPGDYREEEEEEEPVDDGGEWYSE